VIAAGASRSLRPWILAALLAPAVVHAQPANPIVAPGHPWAFDSFAVTPPPGEWATLSKTRLRAVFVRRAEGDGAALVASLVAEPSETVFATAEEFLAHMRTQRGRHIDPSRYEIQRHDENLELGSLWCTRYSMLGSDQPSAFAGAWFVEVAGRSCWHPQSRLIIDLSMSDRTPVGGASQPFSAASEAFFASLLLYTAEPLKDNVDELRAQAEGGHAPAALRLGFMYAQGRGVPPDRAQAERWYRQAAEAGEVDAQYNLGLLYLHPAEGKPDVEQALTWLVRAADQRDAQAQFNLGLLFYQGRYFEPDFSQAYDWFRLAAANGHAKAKAFLRPPVQEEAIAPVPAPENQESGSVLP
jgi:hypothetical protein